MNISFKQKAGLPAYHIRFFYHFSLDADQEPVDDLLIPERAFDFFYIRAGAISIHNHHNKVGHEKLPEQSLRTLQTRHFDLRYHPPLELFGVRFSLEFASTRWAEQLGQMAANCFVPFPLLDPDSRVETFDQFTEQVRKNLDKISSNESGRGLKLDSPANLALYSERHRRRLFKKRFGISQKEMKSIENMHAFLAQGCDFSAGHPHIIDHLEPDAFYDQAHLSRMFKKLTGLSLLEYFETGSLLQENILAVSYKAFEAEPIKIEL